MSSLRGVFHTLINNLMPGDTIYTKDQSVKFKHYELDESDNEISYLVFIGNDGVFVKIKKAEVIAVDATSED